MVSIFCDIFLGIVAITRTLKLVNGSDPSFAMSIQNYDDESIDLWAMNFMFAVEAIEPKFGRL